MDSTTVTERFTMQINRHLRVIQSEVDWVYHVAHRNIL